MQGDQDWVVRRLGVLGKAGVSLGFFSPGLINGKRPSPPDNDPIWRAFIDNGITVTFHIGIGVPRSLDRGWIENDHITFSALGMWAMLLPCQTTLADFAFNGVFERHPELRILVAEHNPTQWLAPYLQRLDAIYEHQPRLSGRHAFELARQPSEYVRERCRFSVFLTETIASVPDDLLDVFASPATTRIARVLRTRCRTSRR